MTKKLTSYKAKEILHDKSVHGHPLTDKQRKFFGAVSKGAVPKAQVGVVTPEMRKGWEAYRTYLDEQGLYGDPRLNSAFGKKTFNTWATKNPKYGVNWETLPLIGQELTAQKKGVLDAVKKGDIIMDTPIAEYNPTDVKNAKSKNPWWPGTEFTDQAFSTYNETFTDASGKVTKKDYGVLPSTEKFDTFKMTGEKLQPIKPVKQKNGGWLDKYNDEPPQAQYGCTGKSCTITGEGDYKRGSRLNGSGATGSGAGADGHADTKEAYWAKVKDVYKGMGVKEADFNRAFEDSIRVGPQFMNQLYAKDFDPNTGKLKPGVSPAAYSGNLRYYAQAPGFKFGQMPTISQILQLQSSQPGGMKAYKKLYEEDYPFGTNPQREYGGPVSKYQDGGSKVSGRSEMDKKLTTEEASKLREENIKGAQQWLTDWYTKRATLPQFTGIANERVEALKTLPKVTTLPVQSLKDMRAQAYYQSVGNKMILPGESTSRSLNRILEKKGLGAYDYRDDSGKILSDYSGMSKPTIAHELGHYLADVVPQGISENKRSGSPLFPQINFVPGKKTNLEPTFYNWITSPGKLKDDIFQKGVKYKPEVDATMINFRMLEGLDPTKVYTAEDFKPIIEKYKKLNLTPEYINTERGDKERLVKYLMESIGNDPEKLAELQNTIVRTSSKRSDNKAQYGKELNYNNSSVSLPDGFEGMGYNTQGRNYSPAWGGQFQDGGKLTSEQLASLNKAKMRAKMAMAAEFGNPAARRMMNPAPPSYRFTGTEMFNGKPVVGFGEDQAKLGDTGTHRMGVIDNFAVPWIQQNSNGSLFYKNDASPRDREAIRFDNPQDAEYFAEHYKEVAPMMQNFAMGGTLPGATGMMYARVGAPSEGPYAKKTKPSAQNGKILTGKEFIDNWIKSPIYDKMLRASAKNDKEYEAIKQGRETNFSQPINIETVSPYSLGRGIAEMSESRERMPTNEEFETAKGNKDAILALQQRMLHPRVTGYNLSISKDIDENSPFYQQVMSHEYGHREDVPWDIKNWSPKEALNKNKKILYTPESDIDLIKNSINFSNTIPQEYQKYINQTGYGEVRGIINEGRYLGKAEGIYDPYTEEINKDQFEKLLNTESEDNPAKRLLKIVGGDKEKARLLMNSISKKDNNQIIPIAQNGMTYYQHGLDWKPKNISKDGSSLPKAQVGLKAERTPIVRQSLAEQMANLRANQQRVSDAPSINLKESEKRKLAEARQKADAKRTFISQGREETPQEKAKNQRLREQYKFLHPNTEINRYTGELQTINPDRGFEGEPLTPNAKRFDRGLERIMGALEAAGYVTGAGELAGAGYNAAKAALAESMESGLLSNAYKLNPWRFKANPEAYYHRSPNLENIINKEEGILQGFGQSAEGRAYTELSKPGMGNTILSDERVSTLNLRKPANSRLYFSKGVPLDYGRYNPETFNEAGKKIMTGQGYSGPYMVEVKDVPMGASTKGRLPGADPQGLETYAVSRRPISLDEAKFYKEDWLRGYKPIETPKQKKGGVIKDDRGQWDHPGEITEIQGNTMATHGYGDIPLYVIPNKGEPRIVEANTGTHKFPGATKFTEIPMAQKGKEVPPIYTSNPNDPRLRAYNDTSRANKSTELLLNALKEYNKNPTEKNKKAYWKAQDENYDQNIKPSNVKDQWTLQNAPDGDPDFYFTYPKAVQPVIYKPEPTLKRIDGVIEKNKLTGISNVKISPNSFSFNNPQVENVYRVEYENPEKPGTMTHQDFPSEKLGTKFQQSVGGSNRGYYIKYEKGGHVPQAQYSGWLDKYN